MVETDADPAQEEHENLEEERRAARRVRRKAVRVLAFHSWLREWRVANPDATADERTVAWNEVRGAEKKRARKALKALKRKGIFLTDLDI